jgi:hypothetical protein
MTATLDKNLLRIPADKAARQRQSLGLIQPRKVKNSY